MSNRSVVVTGGLGFIGRQTISMLVNRGFRVHVLSRSYNQGVIAELCATYRDRVSLHPIDLLASDQVVPTIRSIQATHLLHLAWFTKHGMFWTSPENMDWVASSNCLLKTFIEAGGRRVVGAGTCAEYAWYGNDSALTEGKSNLQPTSLYGQAKLRFRNNLFSLATRHDISAAWGRIFFAFGPHESPQRLVSSAAIALLKGLPFEASTGEQIRDFSFVQDVAAGFVGLLDSPVEGDVNIASGEARSIASLLATIGSITKRTELIQYGAKPRAANDPRRIVASARRLHDEVGVTFVRTIEDRLFETVEWWRTQLGV